MKGYGCVECGCLEIIIYIEVDRLNRFISLLK